MDCIFCEIVNGRIPGKTVYEDDAVRAILDINPASYGHVLVMPKAHSRSLLEASDEDRKAVFDAAAKIGRKMEEALGCDGINVIANIREGAGQTIDHFHVHLIPRYTHGQKPDALHISQDPIEESLIDLDAIADLLKIEG